MSHPVITELRRLMQVDCHEFKASQSDIARPYFGKLKPEKTKLTNLSITIFVFMYQVKKIQVFCTSDRNGQFLGFSGN